MKTPILVLHGWNGRPQRWSGLLSLIEAADLKVFIPQLPGFIKDTENPWSLNNYVDWVVKYMRSKSLTKVVLICHSNGGRIGMKLAAKYPEKVERLILINSAGIRNAPSWKRIFFKFIAKAGKVLFRTYLLVKFVNLSKKLFYKAIREHDYEIASPTLRKTLINILEEDLSPIFSKITIPATLIWGTDDRLTPPASAVRLNRAIPKSKLLWIKGAGHGLPFTHTEELAKLIENELLIH